MDTARSLTSCRFFFLDEYEFYDEAKNIESSRKIAERQIAKSGVSILIASTPNRPDGPAQKLQQEEPTPYYKTYLPYTVGLDTIYTKRQIQVQKKSPSFEGSNWSFEVMVIAQDSDGVIFPRLFIKRIDADNTGIFTVLEVDE